MKEVSLQIDLISNRSSLALRRLTKKFSKQTIDGAASRSAARENENKRTTTPRRRAKLSKKRRADRLLFLVFLRVSECLCVCVSVV